jgi:prolyl-tRNA synthetase
LWKTTARWEGEPVDDVWFKTELNGGTHLGLGFTHEEPMTRVMKNHITSYRDVPKYVYQFQTKFRNELRAKSGIMRGREFLMKDFYSFNRSDTELEVFYEQAGIAYENVFRRAGIGDSTYLTFASGGVFSKFSHEFQCVSTAGEDTIYIDTDKRIAVNYEVMSVDILKDLGISKETLVEAKAIEVGNIFKLGTRFSEPLGLTYKDEDGTDKPVVMGSYGIGIGRLMGTIVEVLCDEKGIVWPESVAPFQVHLVELSQGDEKIRTYADKLYEDLKTAGIEVLYDDRDQRAGEKFADSDLLGIPHRVIVGKTTSDSAIEAVRRKNGNKSVITREMLLQGVYHV